MGTWTAMVYTAEQQARLGVDKFGKALAQSARAPAAAPAAQGQAPAEETVGMPGGLRMSVAQAAQSLASRIGPGTRICVLGGTAFRGPDSEALTAGLASELDAAFGESAVFITGGMAGVQETFAKHCRASARVFNLLQIGGSSGYGVGVDLEAGDNLDERKKVFGQIGDIYITVEGGPGVAQEARDAFKRGAGVVPLIRTGGASKGDFDFPADALKPPSFADTAQWEVLKQADAPVTDSIAAAVQIMRGFASHFRSGRQGPADFDTRATLTPGYVNALLGSKTLLESLCSKYFRAFDADSSGVLEFDEVTRLAQDLYANLGAQPPSAALLRQSLAEFCAGGDSLTPSQLAAWFTSVLRSSLSSSSSSSFSSSSKGFQAAEISLVAKSLSGQQVTVTVKLSDEVGKLQSTIATALGLPPAQTRLAVTATGALLDQGKGRSVGELGLEPGCELSAVALPRVQVRRHVYNARGGAPPYRGTFLTATDEVELEANVPLVDQQQELVPPQAAGGRTSLLAFPRPEDGRAPSRWEQGQAVEVDLAATPIEVFGFSGEHELAILVPMRGMD